MIRKAIIMAGGNGTRLKPLTIAVNKHLLPIYDKPLIYYPLSLMMLIDIKDILIIVNSSDLNLFKKLLGDGRKLGIKINYKVQHKPNGIPESFKLANKFIDNEKVILILGDNIFYGQGLVDIILKAKKSFKSGAQIFTYPVKNTKAFGIAEVSGNKIVSLIEKPENTSSNMAITGFYYFDKNVYKIAKKLKPSKRNETEIIDLLEYYRKNNDLKLTKLGRGSAWLDTGTLKDNLSCGNFVNIIEERQNYKIGCIEEIAYKKKWINKNQLSIIIKKLGKNSYSEYLNSLI